MECFRHKSTVATSTCNVCGNWLCSDCAVEKNGRVFCMECLGIAPPPPHVHHHTHHCKHEARGRHTNGFLFFIFSFMPPGINFMYLGMMKRGLFFLSSFFLTIYLIASFNLTFLPFAIPIIYITSFFDGFATRRRLENGEHVEDGISDIKSFAIKYKSHIVIASLIIIVTSIFKSTAHYITYSSRMAFSGLPGFHLVGGHLFGLICMAAIAYGIYMIGKSRGAKSKDRTHDQKNDM